ncbi:MAG: hypothetical protein LBM00_04270 [Deltaproteobacteria bacterium]|jgi:hypothetical protein|nr:hypothetical protein [Deltaproteobacteria bacterium]
MGAMLFRARPSRLKAVIFSLLLLGIISCSASAGAAPDETLRVTAVGKDAATAEINARVAAVRNVLHEAASADFLRNRNDQIRRELLLKSGDYTTSVRVVKSGEENGLVSIEAVVGVNREGIRQKIRELERGAADEAAGSKSRKNTMAAVIISSFTAFFVLVVLLSRRSKRKARLAALQSASSRDAVTETVVPVQRNTGLSRNVPVRCGGCGALNRMQAGMDGECEFCGSPLSAPWPAESGNA